MAEERGAFEVMEIEHIELPEAPPATAPIWELLTDAELQAVMALRMELPRMAA